ncbi:MAG: hypothetical protein K1X81_14470 [Bacteroidia bacterium]|nr:hypothetical protein [Bacteroidia bacterium]
MHKFIIILILGLYSCSFKKGSTFVTTLTSSNSCWVFYGYPAEQMNNEKLIIGSCTKFYNDFTFAPFLLSEGIETEILSLDKNVSNRGEWNFNADDSTFSIQGSVFKVVTFNIDTITLMNDKNHIQKMVKTKCRE